MSRTAANCFTLPEDISLTKIPNSNALIVSNQKTKRRQLILIPARYKLERQSSEHPNPASQASSENTEKSLDSQPPEALISSPAYLGSELRSLARTNAAKYTSSRSTRGESIVSGLGETQSVSQAEDKQTVLLKHQPSNLFQKETSIKKRRAASLYALTRAMVYNAVMDSANPCSKVIRIGGVGYFAEIQTKQIDPSVTPDSVNVKPKNQSNVYPFIKKNATKEQTILALKLGYTHKVKLQVPKTLELKIDKESTTITLSGLQKCFLGNFAAKVRAVSPIEPYHGKGLSYINEVVRSKVAKSRKNKAKE
jgi:ribosomal protein L6P/L9E